MRSIYVLFATLILASCTRSEPAGRPADCDGELAQLCGDDCSDLASYSGDTGCSAPVECDGSDAVRVYCCRDTITCEQCYFAPSGEMLACEFGSDADEACDWVNVFGDVPACDKTWTR